jgi:hypothetical protein
MLLSIAEREVFCQWLRQSILSNEALLQQMEKLSVTKPLIEHRRELVKAERTVLKELLSGEAYEIK